MIIKGATMDNEEVIADLTLLLMYLTSWEEEIKSPGRDKKPAVLAKIRRTWKGYPFETINMLVDHEYLRGSFRAKSVILTEKGIARADDLKKKYLLQQ
jgi:hypothetical protein